MLCCLTILFAILHYWCIASCSKQQQICSYTIWKTLQCQRLQLDKILLFIKWLSNISAWPFMVKLNPADVIGRMTFIKCYFHICFLENIYYSIFFSLYMFTYCIGYWIEKTLMKNTRFMMLSGRRAFRLKKFTSKA